MVIDIVTASEVLGGGATALGALYTSFRHIRFSLQAKKDREKQAILSEAYKKMADVESDLNQKIKNLEIELEAQKINVHRDLDHMREIYNAEIKVLGEKIDSLRQDLQEQHASMINLLTKLVNSK